MKFIFISSLLLIALIGCASLPNTKPYEERIIGVWHLMDYGYGNYGYSQLGFTKEGRKCVVVVNMGPDGLPKVNYYDNTWEIKNDILVSTVGDSPSSSLPKGYVIKDRIKLLDSQKMNLLMQIPVTDNPRLERHQKLHEVNPERICGIVKNYANFINKKRGK